MRDSIKPFVKELNLDDIIDKLADLKNPSAAEHCQSTLQMFTDNAVESVMNNIFDLLVNVAEKVNSFYLFHLFCLPHFCWLVPTNFGPKSGFFLYLI